MTKQRTLPERLRTLAGDARNPSGDTMNHWDKIRHQVETRKGSDLPRMNFESLIETFAEALDDAADALDAKSAMLAEAEKALEPFAKWGDVPTAKPTLDDCERARIVLAKIKAAQS